jgi:hypothetical protein
MLALYLCIVGVLNLIITYFVLFIVSGIQFAFHWKPNHSGPDGHFVFQIENQDIVRYSKTILFAELLYMSFSVFVFYLSSGYWLVALFLISFSCICFVSSWRFNRTVEYGRLRILKGIGPRDGKEHDFWIAMKTKSEQEIQEIDRLVFFRNLAVFLSLGYNISILFNFLLFVAKK